MRATGSRAPTVGKGVERRGKEQGTAERGGGGGVGREGW